MCGIFGVVGNVDNQLARNCLDLLEHRGPDGSGLWSSDGVTLGHRRLSILDLSESGAQPMTLIEGRYWITFNGEVYNFLEIRKELENKGYKFKSESDTEVVLASYVEWGSECLHKFNGMWSLAIWDDLEKTLFLTRDRFGKKPLFYAQLNDKFVFASEMKAILPLLQEVRPSNDYAWMREHLFIYETTDKCLIDGIKRFPAAHCAIYKSGKLNFKRYWNTLDHIHDVGGSYADQVEEFRELFLDACRIRMRSDVPIGCALSGGLDSSAVLASMAHISKSSGKQRLSDDWKHAFVASFPGTPLDETHYARMVAEHTGVKATYVDIDPVKSIGKLEDYFFKFEEISTTSPIPMMQLYGAVKNHGVNVTIDGHGADEFLVGYPNLLFEFCIGNGYSVADTASMYRELMPKNSSQFKISSNDHMLYMYFALRKVAKIILGKKHKSSDANHIGYKKLNSFNRYLYALSHQTILPTLLRNYDRYSMANSVEIRMPFMDHRLVTYMLSLPMKSKLSDGYTKKIVRDSLSEYMPHDVAYRKSKIGFSSPIVDWMQNDMREYFTDITNSQDYRECNLLNPDKVKHQITNVISGNNSDFRYAQKAWLDFSPYLWEKALIKRSYS